jgi:hypothetical protein
LKQCSAAFFSIPQNCANAKKAAAGRAVGPKAAENALANYRGRVRVAQEQLRREEDQYEADCEFTPPVTIREGKE